MPTDLQEFYHDFFQDLYLDADANGRYVEDAFFERCCAEVIDAGELDTADRAHFVAPRGIRIDGYGGDPLQSEGTLSLIVADFNQSAQIDTLTGTEMEAIFKRATAFLTKSLDPAFRRSLEETSAGFGLADLIANSWSVVKKVRLVLISNRVLSAKVDGRAEGDIQGIPITHSVWDLGRLHRYSTSGRSREEIVVELKDHGGPIAALPAHMDGAGYEAYLLVIPGVQLASIYDRWGPRLLEQNVRVFLQARGNVNKGIRNTIESDPGMFFAYNNGITATAEEVVATNGGGKLLVTGLRNLQIVNGGQTTASIFAASQKEGIDLSKVFVQMKLSVIPPERAEVVVPKISEFANTQNKVNAADFFANHPFHIRMKEISQRVFVPARDGAFRESKWFYERARGQYQDARGGLSNAQRKRFDLEYPKNQVFTKTDLAKFLVVWQQQPDVVSKGAQKNFAHFAAFIAKAWITQPDSFNEVYYKEAIAKAVVFQKTEALVSAQPWYGGYRANIVAYSIAKMAHDAQSLGLAVDFEAIWRAQGVSAAMQAALTLAAEEVKDVIVNPPAGTVKNVTEWAKQQACWNRVAELKIPWPAAWRRELVTLGEQRTRERDAVKEQKVVNGIDSQAAVVIAGAQTWRALRKWGVDRKLLSEQEIQTLDIACAIPSKIPNEKQCGMLLKTVGKLRVEGCTIAPELT
jgi:hypothetical protein